MKIVASDDEPPPFACYEVAGGSTVDSVTVVNASGAEVDDPDLLNLGAGLRARMRLGISESECTAAGRRVMPLAAARMIHMWIGPGYTDAPIFAHDNPELYDGYCPKRST